MLIQIVKTITTIIRYSEILMNEFDNIKEYYF